VADGRKEVRATTGGGFGALYYGELRGEVCVLGSLLS